MLKKILFTVYLFISLFFANSVFCQSVGDYRSAGTGAWTTLSSWQYYDGSTWVTPSGTSPQGYPGQYTGTGSVLIQSGHTITISSTITTLSFGTLTITGRLTLNGDTSTGGIDFYLTTQSIIVTPSSGFVEFNNKVNLRLPTDASLQVTTGGLDVGSGCSANQIIYIGSNAYSKCNGGGALPDFDDLMNGGGTLNPIVTSNSPVCQNNIINLLGSFSGVSGTTTSGGTTSGVNYSWSIQAPNSSILTSGLQNYSFTASQTGSYSVTLTCTTYFGTTLYTNSKTVTVVVNPIPTITGTTPSSVCGIGTVTLGATASAGIINWYSAATGGSPLGTGTSFTTPSITGTTTYYVDATNSGCTTASRTAIVATVNPIPTITGTTPSSICGTGTVTLGATASAGIINWYSAATGGSSLGTGTSFTTPSITGTTTYYVDATNSGCTTTTRTAVVATINPVPVITTQPTNQLDCEGSFVNFKVVASGTGLTYTWQYKRSTDGSFITLTGGETNTTYPSAGEIRIANVGSAQYPDGTQFKVVISNGNCSVISNTVTLSVNEITGLTPSATNVTQCYGTNYTYTVSTSYPANVVSYQWKKSVVSGTWTPVNNGGAYSGTDTATLTITGGTPAESAEYRVYITFNNSTTQCSVDSSTRTRKITFLPLLTTPLPIITQPTCSLSTGTITVTVQSATDIYSFDNGANYQASNVKSGLALGSYNVIIKNTAGCISPTANCQIISETSTWNGASWINGVPDLTRRAVFQQNFSSTSDIDACSCQVTNGANVIINSSHTLKVVNSVDVISGALTFENNASLVQVTDAAVNTGNINYKRYTAPVRRYDFTYWSSPVVRQTLKNLSPTTLYDKYYGYDPNTGWVLYTNGAKVMDAGNGYIIRAPQSFSTTTAAIDYSPMFVGVPNNGVYNLAVVANKANLLGNPYPSAINADVFLDSNSTVLEGTLYFWTHNTPPSDTVTGSALYNYTADDYATYNRTGGVTTSLAATTGGATPTGKIAAGQGFFATGSASGGSLVFNNSMRISGGTSGTNNSQFFKLSTASKSSTSNVIEKSRIWLNLTNKGGAFKQTLIGYITGATNSYDPGLDGVTYDGNPYVDFYSVNQGMNLSIQGRVLPFIQKDSVVLGYKSTIQGDFQISIDHTDGGLTSQAVFLEDKILKVLHDLRKEPYSFSTEKGVFNNRFVLRYENNNVVKKIAEKEVISDEGVIVSVSNNEIKVSSSGDLMAKIIIYDILGKVVYQKDELATTDYLIQHLNLAHQVLFVDVILGNEKIVSTKIVY